MRARELHHFLLLDRDQQAQAVRRLISSGMSETTAAAATKLSVEQIRRILAESISAEVPA
jgi:DNA invertase Pin-like site-specific DNA recombinase